MSGNLPPLARLAMRVLHGLELAVRRFPRYHKYTIGTDLRKQAAVVTRCVHKAWRDSGAREQRVNELCDAVDALKITLQLSKNVGAFTNQAGSFGEFEAIARLVSELGKQSGGWQRKLQSMSQHGKAVPLQSAQILSSQAAHEARV